MLEPPIEDAWADFLRSLSRKGRSPATVEIYRKSFEDFWRWSEAEGHPADPGMVTHRHVNGWVDSMLVRPATRGGRIQYEVDPTTGERRARMVTANTIRIRWQNLRPFFSWWATEMEETNPFGKADTPRLDEHAVPIVSMTDVGSVLHACDGKDFEARRDTALLRLLIDTGARVGEVVTMTVDSWDRRTDLVTLTGKTGTRIVPVSASTGESLARYLRVRGRNPSASFPAMWLGLRGPLTTGGVAQMLYRRCDDAGVARLHPHQLRHTWAHEMKLAGAGEGDLMTLGGWSTPTMVHRYGKSAATVRAQEVGRRIAIGDRL